MQCEKSVCSERVTLDALAGLWHAYELAPGPDNDVAYADKGRGRQPGRVSCSTTADGHPFFDLPGPELLWGSDAMTKSELIQRLSEINPHLYHRDVERIVTTIFDEITDALARGDRVELRGFGAFSVKQRDARIGRNPRTGAAVQVAEKRIPFFKTGKLLRERLNNSSQQ